MNDDFNPTIKVCAFKKSGKYYAEHTSILTPEHYNHLFGFELSDLIRANDTSVHQYSPVTSKFDTKNFDYLVEVDYGPKKDFCYFLLTENSL